MQYSIFEGNLERLEKKLNAIRNKCEKYGCDFHYERIGEEFKEVKMENGKTYTAKFIIVEASGTAIINNWKFIATVEHTEKGNIFKKSVESAEIEIPENYYNADPICEHCNSNRVRKYTYIVQNTENGEFKQVGKACLKDFTNGMSAENIARYIAYFDELIQGEEVNNLGTMQRYYDTFEILCYASETIRHFGYIPAYNTSERNTKKQTMDYYFVEHGGLPMSKEMEEQCEEEMRRVAFDAHSAKAERIAKSALEWLANQEGNGNYMHNLKVVGSLRFVNYGQIGILVSLLPTYDKELEKESQRRKLEEEKQKEREISAHVGKIGDRIEFCVSLVKALTSWSTDFGTVTIYKIVDENGNIFTWKTSNWLQDDFKGKIKGTIKAHNEYKGVKQTELTRCTIKA